MSFPFIITENSVTVCLPGKAPEVIPVSNDLYRGVVDALKGRDFTRVEFIMNPENIKKYVEKLDQVGEFDDSTLPSGRLGELIKQHYKNGYPTDYLENFFKKLIKNPSYRVVNQLFDFIEASMKSGGFTITEEGNIVAYKRVRSDFRDIYSGTFDNTPGSIVQMPRNQVNEDPEATCSAGLHFAAFSYLEHYSHTPNDRIVIVEVSPEDVVAIPSDYNNAKARCCKYKVIGEFIGEYKDEGYHKQPSVINNTKAPEAQLATGDTRNQDFTDLVREALRSETDDCDDCCDCAECAEPEGCTLSDLLNLLIRGNQQTETTPEVEPTENDETISLEDLQRMTLSELVKAYNATIEYHNLPFNKPTKFRDKQTAIERCLKLQQYILNNC